MLSDHTIDQGFELSYVR